MTASVPADFKILDSLTEGFNAVLQPLYIKYTEHKLSFGVCIGEQHLNRIGFCHGGLYMTLMDFACSVQLCLQLNKFVSTPTINFSSDFIAAAQQGSFIYTETQVLKCTRSFAFTQGFVYGDGQLLARANATFKIPSDIAAAPGISVAEFAKRYAISL